MYSQTAVPSLRNSRDATLLYPGPLPGADVRRPKAHTAVMTSNARTKAAFMARRANRIGFEMGMSPLPLVDRRWASIRGSPEEFAQLRILPVTDPIFATSVSNGMFSGLTGGQKAGATGGTDGGGAGEGGGDGEGGGGGCGVPDSANPGQQNSWSTSGCPQHACLKQLKTF
ncbi:hypothetical protein B0H16DRAFT_1689674 [Mycena metata]|uniref:Uncharacterized protein n=1 Tax=Mycena metata TaxID=1033252 RepID=A0AAD7J7T3_9AGAR|nr:hypothetical protein B0H16DRAFT_1689674 [Mycena metata]